jgi:serine/threonine protein kinase
LLAVTAPIDVHDERSVFDEVLEACRPTVTGLARQLGLSAVLDAIVGGSSERVLLGRLELQEKLGEGAMGVVYRAHDMELDRTVAIKVVQAEAGAPARERVMQEARALAKLSDPNVVTIYDIVTIDDDLVLTMELVEGVTLRAWLEANPEATPREIVALHVQAGRGVAAAHRAGVVHRDFKPDNVLVGVDGRVRVADFGLAAFVYGIDDAAGAFGFVGSPRYMAPEIAKRQPASAASDQYSFCVALRDALGRSSMSRRIEPVISRGLRVEPAERWPSMEALVDALEATLSSQSDDTLRLLVERVEALWLDGVLRASLRGTDAIDLPLADASDQVAPSWPIPPLPNEATTVDLERASTRPDFSALIVGSPGSGKTTALLCLARSLLDVARADSAAAVPVVLNLSSFRPGRTLEEWVVEEMVTKYGLPRRSIRRWLDGDRLVLLLDALDEVAAPARRACIEAINRFIDERSPIMVVASRREEYAAVGVELKLGMGVRVLPLDVERMKTLARRHDSPSLITALSRDERLRAALASPLMLSLLSAKRTQTGMSPDDYAWSAVYREHVERAFAGEPERMAAGVSRLACLAAIMQRHETSDLWLERVMPSWLPSRAERWSARVAGIAAVMIVQALVSLIVALSLGRAPGIVALLTLGPIPLIAIQTGGYRLAPVEALSWSWRRAARKVPVNVGTAAAVGALMAWNQGHPAYVTLCAFVGLVLTAVSAFEPADRATRVRPNEGIAQSLGNGVLLALLSGPAVGVVYGYGLWPAFADIPSSDVAGWSDPSFPVAVSVAVFSAHVVFFTYGGAVTMMHAVLRVALAWRTPLPLRLVPFLDDCVRRGLLRRIGGGYMFLHATAQDYFAAEHQRALDHVNAVRAGS